MGNVIELNPTYPHPVPRLRVQRVPEPAEDGPLYEPTPDTTWSELDGVRWLAAVTGLELDCAVTLRASRRELDLYSLQLGARPPITEVTLARAIDILGGCISAADLLRHR